MLLNQLICIRSIRNFPVKFKKRVNRGLIRIIQFTLINFHLRKMVTVSIIKRQVKKML